MNKTRFYSIPNIDLPIEKQRLPKPGIYFLWLGTSLQYIGKSSNVLKRIGEHIVNKVFDSYSIIECSLDEMDKLEEAYIRQYQPPLNGTYTNVRSVHMAAVVDASQYSGLINDLRSNVRFKQYDREAKEAGR